MKTASKLKDLFSDRIWTLEPGKDDRVYAWLVRTWKIIRITFKTFTENRMGFQCVSLSYFITLALVPFLAFAFAITGGLGLDDKITQVLGMILPTHPEIVDMLAEKAGNILASAQGGGLGLVSALMFLWAVLWMMFQVERVFNNVWGILKIPRKLYKRFGFYFLVLFLAPFIVIIFGSGIVYATNMTDLFGLDMKEVRGLFKFIGYVVFYFILVGTMSVMYKYIPATYVNYRYAFWAALIAGLIFMLFQYLYLHTQMFMGRLSQAYGLLAAVPLFLIWLNFSWQIIIYGAQLTYSFQNVDKYKVSAWDNESR
ncbi:MAG: YihY/virulence factor BrkB family protein [Bacteroidales bacterium]|jgi:membrane protein|nr:YihY/virulence factor BrkB family protein [Bacteroidales bacterium]